MFYSPVTEDNLTEWPGTYARCGSSGGLLMYVCGCFHVCLFWKIVKFEFKLQEMPEYWAELTTDKLNTNHQKNTSYAH